jgi:ubiquinone/menaquinone biosynthesis C-methylase UbiE
MLEIKSFYSKAFQRFGASPKGVGWHNKIKTQKRYKNLLRLIKFCNEKKKYSLLDVGCGYGELINFCNKEKLLHYCGIDLVREMILYAKKKYKNFTNFKFVKKNLLSVNEKFDYIICNGVFTLRSSLSNRRMIVYVKKCINHMHKISKTGFAFNTMSSNVDFRSRRLFYPKKLLIENFLKKKLKIKRIYIDKKTIDYEIYYFVRKNIINSNKI